MDEQRIADITAALTGTVGDVVAYDPDTEQWYRAADKGGWAITRQGDLYPGDFVMLGAKYLDLLHAASQIVRRMNHA